MDALYGDIFGADVGDNHSDDDSDRELDEQYVKGSALRCDKCRYKPRLCKSCRLRLRSQHAKKTSALERASAPLRQAPPAGQRGSDGRSGSGSWWSLWDTPPQAYHAEVRRRSAEPPRSVRPAQARSRPAQEGVRFENPEDRSQSSSWDRSCESCSTETRVTTQQTCSFGGQSDVWEASSVHYESTGIFRASQDGDLGLDLDVRFAEKRRTVTHFRHCEANHSDRLFHGHHQRAAHRHRRVGRNRDATHDPEDITPNPSPYEERIVRSVYRLPYTCSTGHAVGLAMWHLWTPNHLESWGCFAHKRVVLRCAGLVGFAETILHGRLPESVGIWRIVSCIVFLEWPRKLLDMMLDSMKGLSTWFRGSETRVEDVD
ncbi:hypothetical protein QBC34DRAFT_401442 [Podospora aff. communis PSN243]|uniref:Zn(2)-C6 fungal-type domain-containing protein n=1 Tax=Podospora aff. communis PSN243 TaxID=3040156 RepID=A0AAV9GS97_9PEZI|nr:hypothetical protein QBC34DRAFT_401442 [Podospora aff. communis PSN243]